MTDDTTLFYKNIMLSVNDLDGWISAWSAVFPVVRFVIIDPVFGFVVPLPVPNIPGTFFLMLLLSFVILAIFFHN